MPPDASISRGARFQRRRRWRRVLAIALGLMVIGGAATAFAVSRNDSDTNAHASGRDGNGNAASTSTQAAAAAVNSIKKQSPPRAISHDAPLRVWVGGDSLGGELGPSLGTLLAPTGVVQTTVDFKVGSGLHNNDLRNWPQEIPDQMAKYTPDVAVFMIGANDASIVSSDASRWDPDYRAKVDTVMDALSGDQHRTVYFVGPPPMRSDALDRGSRALGLLMAQEASKHRGVVYVDAYAMFAGQDGAYSLRLDLSSLAASPTFAVDVSGDLTNVRVRNSDGVHFTNDGATYLAYNVARLLNTQWAIVRQAGGSPLSVTIEHGGGSVPGYKRPRYHNTTSTSPPSTSPPSTEAPTTTTRHESSSTVGSSPTTFSTPTTKPHTTTTGP